MALNNQFKVKNDLNTLGRILSGGTDLATIFSPSNTSWTLSATNGTFGVAGGDTVQFQSGNGVDVRIGSGTDTVSVSGINATTSVRGVASFSSDNFAVNGGSVTVKDGGIANAELAGSITDDKLSTISTAGKVSNSATTATSSNTNNAIVTRGANGEFSAGSITSSGTVEAVTVNATTGFRLNNAATSGHVLRGNGTNFVSSTLAASDIASGQALTKTDDTNVTLTLGGSPSTALLAAASLTLGWSGQLAVARGGTGSNNGSITGTGALTFAAGGSNQDINLTPSGSGEVNIPRVDIDAGTIDGTAIGASSASTGRFTTLETSGNVTINGNLTVSGSATQINTSNLVVSDPIMFLAEGNQADNVDVGFTAAYNHGQAIKRHTGLIRDNSTQQWTLFSNLSTEILSAVQIPLDNPSIQIDTLRANIIGTVTGNLSGMAAQIANGSVSTNSIVNSAVTYDKIQNVSATDRILGRFTAGAGVVEEFTCTLAGRELLDDASASAQRNTLGVGSAQSVTFGEVIVNNGAQSVVSDVFNASSSNNTHTLTTFAKANYNSAKFTVQIKQGSNRCLFEVLATNNNGTWDGTVYGLVGADLLDNIDITTANATVDLAFTFKGTATARTMTVYAQAISD